jgi:hypothetical protein
MWREPLTPTLSPQERGEGAEAFASAEGTLRTFQIAEAGRERDIRAMTPIWIRPMTPIWLVRFNDFLPWLNPVLGLVAGVLAAMVIATAAGRLPVQPPRPAAAVVRVVQQPAPAACLKAALPPDWRDLSRYD